MTEQADRLAERFEGIRRALAAVANDRPTPEQTAEWNAADKAMAQRIRAALPGVPLHHTYAVLQALRVTERLDAAAAPVSSAIPAPATDEASEPDDTDLTEADVDRMMVEGVPVEIVTAPPATYGANESTSRPDQASAAGQNLTFTAPVDRAAVRADAPVRQRADCTELEWAVQERARFERLYTRETVRADLAEQRADTAARDADIYQQRLERLGEGYTEQRKRAEEAEARAEAMERAMESTAADASAHRFCHMRLMAQCQRAEQAEAEAERLRADRATVLREAADKLWALANRLTERGAGVLWAAQRLRRMADETQQPEAREVEDPARIDRIRPEFTEHSSVEAIDAQLQRARSQQRRWHLRAEWLISLRQRRVDQKARGEWPAASDAAVQQPKEA